MQHTFLWHDYETFGISARSERPAQFAAIRTDSNLNEIGEPINILCQPAPDYLPDPGSCLITHITPQQCLAQGLPEHEFAKQIHAAFSQAGTIGVGYNTIRFDDEFTRFLFWRNLIEPYGREWQNGCGRWDILDVVRMCYALRPEGIQWPEVDGQVRFKLELLSEANGLAHEQAHDALSDVRATIGLARLIKTAQPKLWDFALALHKKDQVSQTLGLPVVAAHAKPFIHISGMFPVEQGCVSMLWPLAQHPQNKNEVIAWDLRHDPQELRGLNAAQIRERMFTRQADLPEGVKRLPIKTVHLNKSPMVVAALNVLTDAQAAKWQLDKAQCLQHAEMARGLPDMSAIWSEVFKRPAAEGAVDVDADLYGGFLSNNDRRKLDQLRVLGAEALATARTNFEDARLEDLFFRYRARNFFSSLAPEEQATWLQHCAARLQTGADGARTFDAFLAEIETLQEQAENAGAEEQLETLEQLYAYADWLQNELG